MWELDHKEGWAPKNWCFWTVVLEKTLESPLDCKEIQPVHSKGDQFWVFFGKNDAKAETPILWQPHAKSWLIGKDPDAGRDWGQEEKGMTEDEMVGWHQWLDGRESEWTPGVGDGQGGLACCSPWGRKELDTTEWLNWTDLNRLERHGFRGHWLSFLLWNARVCAQLLQLCLTLCNPMDCSLSVYGMLQARILEWVAISFSRGSSQPRDQTWVSLIAGRFFTVWATREAFKWENSRTWLTILFFFFKLLIYLAVRALVQQAGSPIFVMAWRISSRTMWDLVPCLGAKPRCPALASWSLSHWITGKVPDLHF